MLEGVQDPRNLGAIIRSSVALGVAGLVFERRRTAPLSPIAAKAAAGALELANLCRVGNLPRAMETVKKGGYWVVGTREQGGVPLWEADLPEKTALVVGGEGSGIRPIVAKACDLWITIPSTNPIRTYNVSVATALALYEIMRRKMVK
jgi:23S rRNA (guanosine2251-2'-O)-methyltransferase